MNYHSSSMHESWFTLRRKNILFGYALAAPAIIFLILIVWYPMTYLFRLGFNKVTWQVGALHFEWSGLENFKLLINDDYFWGALKHTAYIVITSVPISFVLSLAVAISLDKIKHGKILLRTALLLPWMIAPALAAAMWRWLYNDQFGIIDFILVYLGIIKNPILWLADPNVAINSIVICDVWQYTPFCTIILFAGLQNIPKELYEAAEIDGANFFQIFWYITIRLLKPQILFILLLRTIFTLRIFDYVFALTKGGPARSTEVLATYLYKTGFQFMKYDYAAVISIALLFITVLVAFGIISAFKGGSAE